MRIRSARVSNELWLPLNDNSRREKMRTRLTCYEEVNSRRWLLAHQPIKLTIQRHGKLDYICFFCAFSQWNNHNIASVDGSPMAAQCVMVKIMSRYTASR